MPAPRAAEDHIRRVVDHAPPLTVAQKARPSALLTPAPSTTDDAHGPIFLSSKTSNLDSLQRQVHARLARDGRVTVTTTGDYFRTLRRLEKRLRSDGVIATLHPTAAAVGGGAAAGQWKVAPGGLLSRGGVLEVTRRVAPATGP